MSRNRNVVVITGASTGIGKATALEFAKDKWRIALVARSEDKLQEVARECRDLGAECYIAPVDVTDATLVQQLADDVYKRWGGFDVWLNNAGFAVVGGFTDVPLEEHRKVIETNLMGYLYGSYSALKVFEKQGSGLLINNASVCSSVVTPQLSAYTASKFAIRGLTQSLRQDLAMKDQRGIHVCQINPGIVDTPAFENAGNYSGRPLKINLPKVSPEKVARAIRKLVDRPRRELNIGPLTSLGSLGYALFPGLTNTILVWVMKKFY